MLLEKPKCTELSEGEAILARSINKDSIHTKLDEGYLASLPRDGKHRFALKLQAQSGT